MRPRIRGITTFHGSSAGDNPHRSSGNKQGSRSDQIAQWQQAALRFQLRRV